MKSLKLLIYVLLFALSAIVYAEGPDFAVGVKDNIVVDCINPTARTDGAAIDWATAGGHVDYYINTVSATTNVTGRMGQGCQPISVDLRPLTSNAQYFLHVKAFDTAERASALSTGFAFFRSAEAALVNLALNKPVTTSGNESTSRAGHYAVDANMFTRWASYRPVRSAEWIRVDLGAQYRIQRVMINWEVAYAKTYSIQISLDGVTWKTVFTTSTGNGDVDDITLTSTDPARYIRVHATVRGTTWGYSIWELAVYGEPAISTPCTIAEETACTTTYNSCMAVCNQ